MKEIFTTSEDLSSTENLFNLFYIYKYMLSLGDSKLIETLLSNDFYLETFGALEYDPELYSLSPTSNASSTAAVKSALAETESGAGAGVQNMRHRDFLTNQVRFKKIVNI